MSAEISIDGYDETTKLHLLELLLNDLHQAGIVSSSTLMNLASDVMYIDYRDDEDLLCFNCLDEEYEEE